MHAASVLAQCTLVRNGVEKLMVWLQVYLDIGMCPEALRTDRTIGDKSALCPAATPVGRITLGLYGDAAPSTAANFKRLVTTGAYTGTAFHKVQAGKWVKAGKQGSKRYGEVDSKSTEGLRNGDLVCTAPVKAIAVSWCHSLLVADC